ncbi:MAG: hypothetical protein P1P64_02110 [Treponemataceae bacterium]
MANEVLLTVTEEERRIAREISENNYQRMLKFESEIAREKGYNKGRAEGHAEGRSEGYEKGEASGLQKGAYKAKLETARKMKHKGFDTTDISDVTGLSRAEINEL